MQRVITYKKSIIDRKSSTVKTTLEFEKVNDITPNFCAFVTNLGIDNVGIYRGKKDIISRICCD